MILRSEMKAGLITSSGGGGLKALERNLFWLRLGL